MRRRHQRTTPLLMVLARLGWQRDPHTWAIPCRTTDRRRAHIHVRLDPTGIALDLPDSGVVLDVLQVGRLRAALADATHTLGRFAPDGPLPHQPRPASHEPHPKSQPADPQSQQGPRHDHRPHRTPERRIAA